jgi:hypothetical protein
MLEVGNDPAMALVEEGAEEGPARRDFRYGEGEVKYT